MDTNEIAWRIRSLLGNQLDMLRMPLRLYPKLPTAFRQVSSLDSFGFSTVPNAADWGEDAEPFKAWETRLREKADQVMSDELSFFDRKQQFLGDPIDWHADWSAERHAAVKLSVLTDYRDFDRVGDCKLVWEPNRHHQLVVLARAYQVTGELRYAQKVVAVILNWIDANPVGYGMNWKSPLELGIRLINWVWALDYIRNAGVMDDDAWSRIVDSIYVAQWDVQRHFSEGSSANNHLIGEAAGVFISTAFLPELPSSAEWHEASRAILENEILNQSFEDGCTREHAFGYQFFVLQFLSLSVLVAEKIGRPLSGAFTERMQTMYEFLADVSADTGSQPNMGDADNGYVLDLGELPDQADALLSVAAQIFGNDDFRGVGFSETAYWLFGKTAVKEGGAKKNLRSRAYEASGYYVLRSDDAEVSADQRVSMVFDCAELGYGSIAAHGHADCLSFTLNIGDHEFLVDPGTYDYFSFPEWRQYFRKTEAHNTVVVDGECQSVSLGPFLWGNRANAKLLQWSDDAGQVLVSGQHDGYHRLEDPVTHTRSVALSKSDGSIVISDIFSCQKAHQVCRHFHVAAGCSVETLDDQSVLIQRSGKALELQVTSGSLQIVAATDEGHLGWVSPGYHVRERSSCIVIRDEIDGDATITTNLRLSRR